MNRRIAHARTCTRHTSTGRDERKQTDRHRRTVDRVRTFDIPVRNFRAQRVLSFCFQSYFLFILFGYQFATYSTGTYSYRAGLGLAFTELNTLQIVACQRNIHTILVILDPCYYCNYYNLLQQQRWNSVLTKLWYYRQTFRLRVEYNHSFFCLLMFIKRLYVANGDDLWTKVLVRSGAGYALEFFGLPLNRRDNSKGNGDKTVVIYL